MMASDSDEAPGVLGGPDPAAHEDDLGGPDPAARADELG
jgi:hypothetical protein